MLRRLGEEVFALGDFSGVQAAGMPAISRESPSAIRSGHRRRRIGLPPPAIRHPALVPPYKTILAAPGAPATHFADGASPIPQRH